MQNKLTQKIIDEVVRRIVEKMNPEKIILFGSHARGDAGPDSDLDLLVIMNVKGLRRKISSKIRVLLADMDFSKDIIVVKPQDVEVYQNIPGTLIYPALHEGKIIYDRAA